MPGEQTAARRPLNGEKTHPLSKHAIDVLRDLTRGPIVRHLVNPGVNNRFAREGLAEEVTLPFGLKGVPKPHVQITDAGRAALEEIDNAR